MEHDRKCILCETVHASRQDMDEHMRSMLHHRELEKLKGRDCGHECRVCKVMVVSLTEYASHISSTVHKQNVEAAEQRSTRPGHVEDYFDQVLVDLIEKRKETIRKEKEVAEAKLAREKEERRRKEEFQQRLKEAKEQYQLDSGVWKQQQAAVSAATWYRGYRHSGRDGGGDIRPWQGKSATWHAQKPFTLHKWGSEEFSGINMQRQEGWASRQWDKAPLFSSYGQPQLPRFSNGSSNDGVYSHNKHHAHQGSQHQSQRRGRPLSHGGPRSHTFQSAPSVFRPPCHQFNKGDSGQDHIQGHSFQSGDRVTENHLQDCNKNSKVHSNQDHRWSPYPLAKGAESVSHRDPPQNSLEKHPRVPSASSLRKGTTSDSWALRAPPPPPPPPPSPPPPPPPDSRGTQVQGIRSQPTGPCSSSRQHRNEIPTKSSTHRSLLQKDLRISPAFSPRDGTTTSAASSPQLKKGDFGPVTLPGGHALSTQKRPLPDILKKARQVVAERRNDSRESKQEQKTTSLSSGVDKKNTTAAAPEEPLSRPVDSSLSLQSLQVSTSMTESAEAVAPGREEEETEASGATGASETNSGSDNYRTSDSALQQVSGLSLLDLPPVLKRDLTKHISAKSKTGGHEPNLNIARRVRRSDSEKDSGLRPKVRQLISSSGSLRNVNWEQVYQEVKKKQDKIKGMPRFGIEMVPVDQEDQSQEEDNDIPLLEGFHWDQLMDSAALTGPQKRSLSESSLAPSSDNSAFPSLTSADAPQKRPLLADGKQQGSSVCGIKDVQREPELVEAVEEKQIGKGVAAEAEVQWRDSLVVDSDSVSEQPDGQGTGKRRRTVTNVLNAEMSCSEHNSKRQKVKSRNERQQIDQLLAVSLREEELSGNLQSVETSLIQARATLEAAYLEVQRLSVVKQQMTADMNALRNKRIEILKGMQGRIEEVPQLSPSVKTETQTPAVPPAGPPPSSAAFSPSPGEQQSSPPSSSLPFGSVTIKQEPQSPVQIKSEPEFADQTIVCAHSTTPELQGTGGTAAAASPSGPALFSQELFELQQADPRWLDCGQDSADWKEKHPEASETSEKCVQTNQDGQTSVKLSPSRRDSHLYVAQTSESMAPPLAELRGGKRVRKLKKRRLLKKPQGAELPDSSDTELDGEALKPRWLRPRRRLSSSSQLTTFSSHPSEEHYGNIEEETPGQEQVEKRSYRHDVKHLLQPTTNLDSDDNTEVCRQSHTNSCLPDDPAASQSFSPQQQQHSLGCNEVTSTSDMDICKSSESDIQGSIILCSALPMSSFDISSDHRGDELPTEGSFEGHQEAVNAVQIHNGLLYTCSGDRTVRAFDLVSHKCVSVFEGHTSKVSCLLVSAAPGLHHRLYSGSSDQTIRCYNLKTRQLEQQFGLPDRVLCLISRWKTLFAGLANGTLVTFNLKTNKQMAVFECHAKRAVSCLALSQEGARRLLLTGSFDGTISVRDAKSGLLLRTLLGHTKTVLCMNVVNDLVFSGSSDHCIYAHNIHTGELVQVYKGHNHAVTMVTMLGKLMVTACLDKLVRVYDLQSQEQLQVYGGHKDMVMCMAVHRNMIYTGCYDGSVQAVKLNLLQNFRCWWQGCSLVFGQQEHLQHHLVSDHGNTSVQTPTKCRWRGCEEVFCTRTASKQAMLAHLQKHGAEAN